ncbi:MAG: hypothetical protein KAX49_00270 [Halanaerobiales bacterium]|nr:hypothetical protein [Halanaerobiales bacterium]
MNLRKNNVVIISILSTYWGGNIPTPRALCNCEVCKKAREFGEPYKRNSSSLYINDINGLIDYPEDITEWIRKNKVKKTLFTHIEEIEI